ncbi:MAG: Poly-beta,6-N-acetyl-D-glucosamine synthase [Bacteroidota bacterium]|jgi:cellulose synthase/poly-beta-1,6-N-acetylglucosamine synthase-like glycosyltransferase/spore germination protein YaaH/peptidoglycan/xylan/chitin deacetylase (PgdA/CDA1 family)
MQHKGQIFQTDNKVRYYSFKWAGRIFLFLSVFLFIVVGITFYKEKNPTALDYQNEVDSYRSNFTIPADNAKTKHIKNVKYKGIKDFLLKKVIKEDHSYKPTVQKNKATTKYVRAAFFTAWDKAASMASLQKYGNKINIIFPEWFFIDPKNPSRIINKIDLEALDTMRSKGIKIMPMLSNFNSDKQSFDGKLLHEILINPNIQQQFIQNLVDTLSLYKLQGINVDFEELIEKTNEPLNNFQQKLYNTLHSKGLIVTQDVAVDNADYDFEKLINYNDYIVLMAYDQYNNNTQPGPIAGEKWVEKMVDLAAAKMQSDKIILGLAGYGYDWKTNPPEWDDERVEDVSYAKAIDRAKISGSKIDYDDNSYNLHYTYEENLNTEAKTTIKHEVWLVDAATTYNFLRFSDEYGLAGTALWRLGNEDPRIWKFYNRSLNDASIKEKPFDYNALKTIPINPNQKPTSVGEGELLNIIYPPQPGKINLAIDTAEQIITEQNYTQLPSGFVYQKFAEDTTPIGPGHKIILTFDDGPSSEYTPKILDLLKKEKIKATFFVVGLEAEKNIGILKRIYKEGHEIGNHTFTHHNLALMSPNRASWELKTTRVLIEAATGHTTLLFRAPYNADSQPETYEEIKPLAIGKNDNYITVGESIDPNDWATDNADTIVNRTIRLAEENKASIILLHDAGGESRQATLDALPRIIKYFKDRGCQFSTVAELMGKTREEVMPKVKKTWEMQISSFFATATNLLSNFIFSLFLVGIFLSVLRMIFMAILAWQQKTKEDKQLYSAHQGLVSVIIPAYNEEINAVHTINSLLQQDYPELELVFVDDGSKDNTLKVVTDAFSNNNNVTIVSKENGGKASALNVGIQQAKGEYVVCIDADSQFKTDAITQLMRMFNKKNNADNKDEVAAVAGNVKVGNEVNMITKWQSIEYITSQNFDRRAFDFLNCITVVPGAIGAFKKDIIMEAGGLTTDTLAEDCDLTIRILRLGYTVRNCTDAISYTEAPETLQQFYKQRFRWSFGVMQCFWKHRDTVFNPEYKFLGLVAMPNILIYQILLPFLAPLADILLVLSLIAAGINIIPASPGHILLYYLIFSIVDIAGAALAFAFEKEKYNKLWWMIPQRFIYRQLMYFILIKSFNKALKGELQGWGALKRTGNVKV